MSSDHVLIKLSDFKEICTDLKRSGDIIKGVLKNTLKNKTEIKRAHVKRASSDKKSHKKALRPIIDGHMPRRKTFTLGRLECHSQ